MKGKVFEFFSRKLKKTERKTGKSNTNKKAAFEEDHSTDYFLERGVLSHVQKEWHFDVSDSYKKSATKWDVKDRSQKSKADWH